MVQEISRRDGISLPISPMDSINSWHTSPESGSNPGIDRPNARYNSALWLRAASPEKKRNANPMAREGRRVKSGREREERRGGYAPRFSDPRSLSLLCNRAPPLAYKGKGNCGERLRGRALRHCALIRLTIPDASRKSGLASCRRSATHPFEANRSIRRNSSRLARDSFVTKERERRSVSG